MPFQGAYAPEADPDALDQASAALPLSQGLRTATVFDDARQLTGRALQYGRHLALDTLGIDPADPVRQGDSMGDIDTRLPPEQLNARYGVPDYLRFNEPHTAEDAQWLAAQAHQRQFRDFVLSNTRPSPLMDLGASLAGALTDPGGLALMASTDGLGELALGGLGVKGLQAGEAGTVLARLGRLANVARVPAEGAINQIPYVGVNAALSNYAGDDYGFGDALRDIAAGAVFHTGVHALNVGLRAALRRPGADAAGYAAAGVERPPEGPAADPMAMVPPEGVPDAVRDLPPTARMGAFAKAVDDLADDRPVDVGQYVQRELEPPNVDRLDEDTALAELETFRPLDEDTAITPRGTEFGVRYGLAELGDLVTSHDDNLQPNPAYPQELQPRDRSRAGAQARNYQLETELNPRLLMSDVSAASGAPVVSPSGVVESGNGRLIALRRNAASGGEAWGRYQAELKARGFDATGMRQPVLVRMRSEPLTGAQRAALAREMNADVTERMSGVEQAMADARRLDDALAQVPDDQPVGGRDLARAFIDRVAPDQVAGFVDREGRLSPEGLRRIRAALLARAYEDPRLVGQVFEGEESAARQLGEALADAAPQWARLRQMALAGDIPRELDLTAAVNSAMDLVRYARSEGIELSELLSQRLGQTDMFSGEAVSPATEAFLRLFYRDEGFKKPMPRDRITWALKDYARQAMAIKPGPDLFGDTAGENTARQIVENLRQAFARNDPGPIDIRPPGRTEGGRSDGAAAEPPVVDLRRPGEDRAGEGSAVPGGGGGGAEGEGGGPSPPAPLQPQLGKGDLWRASADELQALLADKSTSDDEKLVQALGEAGAKEFKRLDRMRNSSDPARADRGSAEFDEKFGDLTPEQERLVYGIGETNAQVDDIKAVLAAHSDVGAVDPDQWVSYMAALSARQLRPGDLAAVPAGEATAQAQAAFVRMQLAYEQFAQRGVDPNSIPRMMADALVNHAGWQPEQAAEIIGSFVDDLTKGREVKAAEQAKLAAPQAKRLEAPKRLTAEQLIAADPELKALQADTERLAAENGVEVKTPDKENPDTLAKALHAAAVCLAEEVG